MRTIRKLIWDRTSGEQTEELPDDDETAIRRIAEPLKIANGDAENQQGDS